MSWNHQHLKRTCQINEHKGLTISHFFTLVIKSYVLLSNFAPSSLCGAQFNVDEQTFKTEMGKVRTSVEWLFKKILKYFAFLDFLNNSLGTYVANQSINIFLSRFKYIK